MYQCCEFDNSLRENKMSSKRGVVASTGEVKNSLGVTITSSEANNRFDLMSEIRQTGGFAGANLKPPSERRLPTSKQSKKKIKGGGDMMADLKNMLRLKRKS